MSKLSTNSIEKSLQTKLSINELHWRESAVISGVTIKAIEGQHWGARLPWQRGMEANSLLLSKNGVNIFLERIQAILLKLVNNYVMLI